MIGVRDVRRADRVVGHDLLLILEWVTNIAVLIALRADFAVVELILIAKIEVPLVVVAVPGDIVLEQYICDAPLGSARNREWRVVGVRIGIGVASVAEVTGVVIVQQVVVAWIAVRRDRRIQRAEVAHHRSNSRL